MDIKKAKQLLYRIDIRFFLSGITEQSNYIVDKANECNIAIQTVLNELDKKDFYLKATEQEREYDMKIIDKLKGECLKKDKIINEIAKNNVKLKGYEIQDEYVKNTINFFTKKVENDDYEHLYCYECAKKLESE